MRFFRRDEIPREVHVKASLEAGEALEITVHSDTTAIYSPKVRITGSGKLDVAFPVRSGEGFIAQVVSEYKVPIAEAPR